MADAHVLTDGKVDLAPAIYRQRLVVEGLVSRPLDAEQICRYLNELSDVCGMRKLMEPVTHRSERYGWAGWIHWETSGAHLYAWERPVLFFSVDIYTCAPFNDTAVLQFSKTFFDADEVVGRSF